MAKLNYITRGDSSPQGKERVYFACHPSDLKRYFGTVCMDILRTQNCAVYYDQEPNVSWDYETMEADLGLMQLFVFPITTNFLRERNKAREVEIEFAKKHHIPLLPLMQEPDLAEDFNKICGNLQYLDREANKKDPTELPYDQKLADFLSTVLLGDNLAATVRGEFYDSIFLSYRKRDRKYAQKLMEMIHQLGFCRDIAIWYDEFLVPGENYNNAILHAIEKSGYCALAVTPNFLEKENYILTTEFPAIKRAGKKTLAVDMTGLQEDEAAELMRLYDGMPALVGKDNHQEMERILSEQFGKYAGMEEAEDPQHLYLIGLAYLNGIDTEKNSEMGAGLLRTAADRGNVPAIKKLSQMYRTGDCVPKDNKQATEWQKKLVELLEQRYSAAKSRENGEKLLPEIEDLAYCYKVEDNKTNAESTCQRLLNVAEELTLQGSREGKKYINIGNVKLGDLYKSEREKSESEQYYLTAAGRCEEFLKETPEDAELLLLLAGDYVKLGNLMYEESKEILRSGDWSKAISEMEENDQALKSPKVDGYVEEAKGRLRNAKEWFMKAKSVYDMMSVKDQNESMLTALASICEGLGDISYAEKDAANARKWYAQANDLYDKLESETYGKTGLYEGRYLTEKLGKLEKEEKNYALAQTYYMDVIKRWESEAEIKGNTYSKNRLAQSLAALGDVYMALRKPQKARAMYRLSYEVLRECRKDMDIVAGVMQGLIGENAILNNNHLLRMTYDDTYDYETRILEDLCSAEKSAEYHKKKILYHKDRPNNKFYEYYKEDYIHECESLLSDLSRASGNWELLGEYETARKLCESAIRVAKHISERTGKSERSYYNLRHAYQDMSYLFQKQENYEEAAVWSSKAVEVAESRCREYANVESFKDLWLSYSLLETIYEKNGDMETALGLLVTILYSITSVYSEGKIQVTFDDIADSLAYCCNDMGKLAKTMPAYKDRSAGFFQLAHDLWEDQAKRTDIRGWLRDLSRENAEKALRDSVM